MCANQIMYLLITLKSSVFHVFSPLLLLLSLLLLLLLLKFVISNVFPYSIVFAGGVVGLSLQTSLCFGQSSH